MIIQRFRKMKVVSGWLMLLFVLTLTRTGSAFADADTQKLLDKISALEAKVSQLEGRVSMTEHVGPGKEVVPHAAPSGEGLLKSVEDIHVGGYVSTGYNYNWLSPNPDGDGGTARAAGVANANGNNTNIRAFDRDANSFGHNGQLEFEKMANEAGTAGFRADLMFGRDAQILNAATFGDQVDQFFVEQAYVHYIAPIGNGIDIKAGRFVTIAGAEVIESKDNWNSSRSLLFTNAIPFTHNGILGSYKLNDMVDVKLGLANGWDTAVDNNKSKTVLSQVALHPAKGIDFTQNFLIGSEQTRAVGGGAGRIADGHTRGLLDSVLAVTPLPDNERWKLLLKFDYGWEEKVGLVGNGAGQWHGFAAGTKYDVNDWLTLAGRWEYFSDTDGARLTGLNGLLGTERNTIFEMTYTADVKLAKNLISRLEWRYDSSTDPIFDLSNNSAVGARDGQHTVGAEMIYAF